MMYSEVSNPQVWYGKLSRKTSRRGGYGGTRSCVMDKLRVDALRPINRKTNPKRSLIGSPGMSGSESSDNISSSS